MTKTKWPKQGTPEWDAKVKEIKAKTKTDSKVAMDAFEKTWGTRNTKDIVPSLRATIKGSKNPGDWGKKALKHFRGEETINELSKELLTRYVRKAAKSSIAHTADNSRMIRSGKKDDRTYTHNLKIEKKRDTGVNRAMKSIAREETIDELSKDKLRNYIAASRKDAVKTITSPVNLSDRSKNNPGNWRRIEKRTAGSELAKKKLAREETINEEPLDNPALAAAIKKLAAKKKQQKNARQQQSGMSNRDLNGQYESAELADIGMAAMGAMAAHSVIHHATGALMHSTGHHLKNLVSKIKTKLGGKTAKVAGTTATKPSSVDKPAANDNAPKALPKVKTTITHSEETQPTLNQLMLARSRRLGVANQIAYYENAVKNEHRYTAAEQRKLDQDSGKDLDRQARKAHAKKAIESNAKKGLISKAIYDRQIKDTEKL